VRADIGGDPRLAARFGPYVLVDLDVVPIGDPLPERAWHGDDGSDGAEWHSAPDGRYVIDLSDAHCPPCTALAYAFWRISTQPLATVARPPLDRPARRRAARARIVHDTRVVMLRRTQPLTEPADGEAKWHYRVRFIVRGHWRRLTDTHGRPYRIWINAYIKGPDGAPPAGRRKSQHPRPLTRLPHRPLAPGQPQRRARPAGKADASWPAVRHHPAGTAAAAIAAFAAPTCAGTVDNRPLARPRTPRVWQSPGRAVDHRLHSHLGRRRSTPGGYHANRRYSR